MFAKPWARALAIFGHPAHEHDAPQAVTTEVDQVEARIEAMNLDHASPAEAFDILRRSVMSGGAGERPVPVRQDRTPPHMRHVAAGVEGALSVYRYDEIAPAPRKSTRSRSAARAT